MENIPTQLYCVAWIGRSRKNSYGTVSGNWGDMKITCWTPFSVGVIKEPPRSKDQSDGKAEKMGIKKVVFRDPGSWNRYQPIQ